MIENAVASTLMRLPVAELSALRKVFLASPGGLSLEGFVAAMLPSSCKEANGRGGVPPPKLQRQGTSSSRRQSTSKAPSTIQAPTRSPPLTAVSECLNVSGEAVSSGSTLAKEGEGGILKNRKKRRRKSASRVRMRRNTTKGVKRSGRGMDSRAGGARSSVDQLTWGDREGGVTGWSLSEEERVGIVTDLVELFQQVDHNGDQVMEWEEFTGFVIDQVLALTREAPIADRLKVRSLGARDKPSVARSSVRRVRYDKNLMCVFSCTGPIVEVWDPAMRDSPGEGASYYSSTSNSNSEKNTMGLFAYSISEETRGFEIGTSAALTSADDDEGSKATNVGGVSCGRRPLHGNNPNKNRDGAPVNVVALDVKYIEERKLLMVLRSDLTLAFFLAENNFLRVGLVKIASQQYVLEHCTVTDVVFTSGCDGSILTFSIETTISNDSDQPQYIVATVKPTGVLRRHTDVVQDMLVVHGSEAEGGQRLVSCGLDRRVCVWDIVKGTFVQSKHGNRAAIRSLAFDPQDNVLLGAGVEGEVLVWDMWARLGAPLFRLQGHRSPVVSIACAPGKGRAASLDDAGKMILWDSRRNAVVDNNERYLCQVDCSSNRPTSLDVVCDDTDDYLRWSHIGVSVVTSGRYMKIYDAVDPREPDHPLSAALYSRICVSFITCNGPFITLWDGCTGRAVRTDRAMEGDIMRACLDGGERRLLLASSLGEIVLYRFLQGTRIRTLSPGHDGPVSGLSYVKEDKVIITGGWDRSLRVYDEVPREGDPPLLRQVEGAHSSDINVVSSSQRLSLLASGSAGGSCRLWDFQFLSCEGSWSIGNGVLCLCFLEPHPLVAVGDAGGYISIIPVRPWSTRHWGGASPTAGRDSSVLLRLANDREAEGTIEGPAAVTCLTHSCGFAVHDSDVGGVSGAGNKHADIDSLDGSNGFSKLIVYAGDDSGTVRAWEVGEILSSVLERPELKEEDLPRSKRNYDPRRRFNKQSSPPPRDIATPAADSTGTWRNSAKCDLHSSVVLSDGGVVGKAPGVLQDSDEAPTQRQGQSSERDERRERQGQETGLGGGLSTPQGFSTGGVALIGQWTPHSEAVVSLEVLQDPPCLLTASRDRSVKLRALPTNDQRPNGGEPVTPGRTGASTPSADAGAEEEKDKQIVGNTSKGDDSAVSPCSMLQPHQNGKGADEVESTSEADETARLRNGSSGNSAASMSSSKSTQSTTSTKIPSYGHDLCTLTMGRTADGFRRDTYSFPVDLRGRGEGRAVEARAVLQAIEEIEARKDKRKREEEAINRARGGAAAAAATNAMTLSAPQPPSTSSAEAARITAPDLDSPEASLVLSITRSADGKSQTSSGNPENASGQGSPSNLRATQQQHGAENEPCPRQPPKPPPGAIGQGGALLASGAYSMQRVDSAAALHVASTTFGVKATASASRLGEQYMDSPPPHPHTSLHKKSKNPHGGKGADGDSHNNDNNGHAMYENLAIEEQRLKNLEASSRMAARCAREAVTIKELLEPTPFLLSQMPDALSSYPAITAILKKSGGIVPPRLAALSGHPRGFENQSGCSERGPVVGQKTVGISSSCPSLQQSDSTTEGSQPSCSDGSYDRPPGEEQPSVLDYSDEVNQGNVPNEAISKGTFVPYIAGEGHSSRDCIVGRLPSSPGLADGAEAAEAAPATAKLPTKREEAHCVGDFTRLKDLCRDGFISEADDSDDASRKSFRPINEPKKVKSSATMLTTNGERAQRRHSTLVPGKSQCCFSSRDVGNDKGLSVPDAQRDGGWEKGVLNQPRDDALIKVVHGAVKGRGTVAKVKTRSSPRRKVPRYLSASPDGFGAASRWGALSKVHLEFHRLGTAGILSSLSCPSLQRHLKEAAASFHGTSCKQLGTSGTCMTGRRSSCGVCQDDSPPPDTALVPTHLDDMAQRHAQAQAQWKRRVSAFAAEIKMASGGNPQGKSSKMRLKKIRQRASRRPLHNLAVAQIDGGGSRTGGAGKQVLPLGRYNKRMGYRSLSGRAAVGRRVDLRGKGGERELAEQRELLQSKTRFGPYDRNEMFALWRACNMATKSGNRVDVRVLLRNPLVRDNDRYTSHLLEEEVLGSHNSTAPVFLTREDALVKMLPKLSRVEARTFTTVAKLMEKAKRVANPTDSGQAADGSAGDDEEGDEVEPEKLRELRNLFRLYDIDRSGKVDAKEIVTALQGNYSTTQLSAGMGDAVTEGEISALLSSLSAQSVGKSGSSAAADSSGTTDGKRRGLCPDSEVDFESFVRLFRGVF